MRPKAWIYGRAPRNTGALQVKQMLDGPFGQKKKYTFFLGI